jgi:hypothetical protein
LPGTWHYLDGKYLALSPCLEELLAYLVLYPQFTAIGDFGGSAFTAWVLVTVCFTVPLYAATLSTCVIAFLACDLKQAS